MVSLLCTLWLLTDAPKPLVQWKVPFSPACALVTSDGKSLFFNDIDGYVYDETGNLIHTLKLDFEPESAYCGPKDSVWLRGKRLMGLLNEHYRLQWQREMEPPTLPPFPFQDYLVYATEHRIQLLDPADGNARFSSRHPHRITGMRVWGDVLWIADSEGTLSSWDPLSGKKDLKLEGQGRALLYMTPGPSDGLTLSYDGGLLRDMRANGSRLWQRDFHIQISAQPIWLKGLGKPQLVVSNHARRVLAYGQRGDQKSKTLLTGRPKALVKWSDQKCLIIPGLGKELVWYDGETQVFFTEKLENYQILVVENGSYVLLVDKDDIIRIYQR